MESPPNISIPFLSLRDRLLLVSLGLIILGVRLHLIFLSGSPTPYWDDWVFGSRLARYMDTGINWDWIIAAANGHRGTFSKLITISLFEINGRQWDVFLGMVLDAFLWAAIGLFLIRLIILAKAQINVTLAIGLILLYWIFPVSYFNLFSAIQIYVYLMILFTVLGTWLACARVMSAKWGAAMLLLLAASFTSGGGTFAAVAVASTCGFYAFIDKDTRRDNLVTATLAGLISLFGISLLLTAPDTASITAKLDFGNAIITFLKVLSWPFSTQTWPSVFFMLPIVMLIWSIAKSPKHYGRFGKFVVMLAAFSVLLAFSIAYARNLGYGAGPAPRYYEYLTLYSLSSGLALMLLQGSNNTMPRVVIGVSTLGWVIAFICSFPSQLWLLNFKVDERKVLVPIQQLVVDTYSLTGNTDIFKNRKFREIPYPEWQGLAEMLDDMRVKDMLPYQFQTPASNLNSSKGPFTRNGIVKPQADRYRTHENVLGSYNLTQGAQNAVGFYSSEPIYMERPYVAIPVTGYLGFEGQSLKLVGVKNGDEVEISPSELNSIHERSWRTIIVRAPEKNFRVVASDDNKQLWFGFATPRSVGALSYYAELILKSGHTLWKLGLLLLLIVIHREIIAIFAKKSSSTKLSPS